MTRRYYRTSYGYKSHDGDFGGAVLGGLLFLALVVWVFSVIFIPLLIILVLYVIYYFCQESQQRSTGTLIVLSVMTAIAGVCFMIQRQNQTPETAVAAPKIEISSWHYFGGFLKEAESKTWTYGDGIEVKMSDNVYYNYYSDSNAEEVGDYLKISVSEDAKKSSSEKIEVSISGGITRENIDGSITLNNQDFPKGETKFTVTARNSVGEVSKTVIVNKVSVAEECARYDKEYNGDFTKLVDAVERYCKAWKSYTEKNQKEQSKPSNTGTPSGGVTSSSGSATSRTCAHYEAGRCWDDLEMEAYDQGRYDKTYGSYGQGYYGSDDCDAVCDDILSDAYEEGYYDGW